MDEMLTTMDGCISSLEATCKELMADNDNLCDKRGQMEARSRRENIMIIGVNEGAPWERCLTHLGLWVQLSFLHSRDSVFVVFILFISISELYHIDQS